MDVDDGSEEDEVQALNNSYYVKGKQKDERPPPPPGSGLGRGATDRVNIQVGASLYHPSKSNFRHAVSPSREDKSDTKWKELSLISDFWFQTSSTRAPPTSAMLGSLNSDAPPT
ncbi:hypothetical protein CC2G_000084 [Coprinopsis cinerea AmutBmut pab1-1]|nr:hypothetical protein CC2G_000084 [Coprinopsis cinerea AmutBmut pab1-1]